MPLFYHKYVNYVLAHSVNYVITLYNKDGLTASDCRKTYITFKIGCLALLAMLVLHRAKLLASNQSVLAWGVAPMRVVSRWCRCVVQRLCATDCKHPCLVRAAAPNSAPARTPGVYAQMLCTMQSQLSIHSLSPRGRGFRQGCRNKDTPSFARGKAIRVS